MVGPPFLGFVGIERLGPRRSPLRICGEYHTRVWVDAMTAKHGPSDENLLRVIAEKEKELEAKVAQAREQAGRAVEDARRQAEAVREQARREAAAMAERAQAEIAREQEALLTERVRTAQAEAERVRARAAERMAEAVDLVVKRVLGGLAENQSPVASHRSPGNDR